jgi:hypothetical protein
MAGFTLRPVSTGQKSLPVFVVMVVGQGDIDSLEAHGDQEGQQGDGANPPGRSAGFHQAAILARNEVPRGRAI